MEDKTRIYEILEKISKFTVVSSEILGNYKNIMINYPMINYPELVISVYGDYKDATYSS